MLNCLICTSQKDHYNVLKEMIISQNESEVYFVQHQEDVKIMINKKRIGVLMIELPFTNDHHDILFISQIHQIYPYLSIIVFIAKQDIQEVKDKLEKIGAFIISMPLQKEIFKQLLSFVYSYDCYRVECQTQQQKLMKQIAQMKQIYQAKCLLMENEYMSEAMAHRYIEKEAMNQRVSKMEIVKSILIKYQNLI